MSRILPSLPWLLAVLAALTGCGSLGSAYDDVTGTHRFEPVSEQELFAEITGFLSNFTNVVQQVAKEADRMHGDVETRRKTLAWRIQTVQNMMTILSETDAKRALTDLWVYMLQVQAYQATPDGKKLFGESLPLLEKSTADLIADVEKIAATVIPPDKMAETKQQLVDYVKQNPVEGGVIGASPVGEAARASSGKSTLGTIVSAPLAPFRAFDGVSEGAAAMNQFAIIGNRFATIFQAMPQQLMWQAQLALLDLDQSPAIDSLTKSVAEASAASASIAETARTLPGEVGKQLRTTLDDVATQQAELRQTIAEADKTAESLTATANAVRAAVEAINTVFLQPDPNAPPPKPTDQPARPFDITEYTAAADSVAKAADELRLAIAEADKSSSDMEQVAGRIVDRMFWAGVILIAVALVAMVVHRLVVRRLPVPRA